MIPLYRFAAGSREGAGAMLVLLNYPNGVLHVHIWIYITEIIPQHNARPTEGRFTAFCAWTQAKKL